jgi:Domain of unknown function (DUF4145)
MSWLRIRVLQTDEVFSEELRLRTNPITGETEEYLPHNVAHWPAPTQRMRPEWLEKLMGVDFDLYFLLAEVYVALDHELHVLAAIGIRTAVDRASELLDVDPAKRFSEKLNDLVSSGKVGVSEKDSLGALTEAGSAAAHRGWRPKPTQLATMMGTIEAFIYRNFVLDAELKELKSEVPEKPKLRTRPTI